MVCNVTINDKDTLCNRVEYIAIKYEPKLMVRRTTNVNYTTVSIV